MRIKISLSDIIEYSKIFRVDLYDIGKEFSEPEKHENNIYSSCSLLNEEVDIDTLLSLIECSINSTFTLMEKDLEKDNELKRKQKESHSK